MNELAPFESWYVEQKDFLDTHGVSKAIAEMIWESANTSAMHNIVTAIKEGSVKLSF